MKHSEYLKSRDLMVGFHRQGRQFKSMMEMTCDDHNVTRQTCNIRLEAIIYKDNTHNTTLLKCTK